MNYKAAIKPSAELNLFNLCRGGAGKGRLWRAKAYEALKSGAY